MRELLAPWTASRGANCGPLIHFFSRSVASCSSPSSITRRSSCIEARDRAALVLDVDWSRSSNWRRSSRIFSRACLFFERT